MLHTDNELLRLIGEDNEEAFSFLYKRYWEELFIVAARALRSKEVAADVVQDVFLSLWNRRNKLYIQGSIPAYLHTCIRYKCIHYIEKNITRRDYIQQLTSLDLNIISSDSESNLQIKEMQTVINTAIEDMPPKMKEAYNLSRNDHLTHKEIAGLMDISVETVKKHIQRALLIVKRALLPHTIVSFYLVFF